MKHKLEMFLIQKRRENKRREEDLNSVMTISSGRGNLTHKYNNTKMFISELEQLLKD
jgi:hypothetical protein|tara:strand:- start:357 stop:527 length:171 start_codon:yes stop_codon:yes gene_type:complete